VAILATALGYPNHTGPKSKISCLHDQPEAGKVCFTVSDVCVGGGDLPPIVGVRRP